MIRIARGKGRRCQAVDFAPSPQKDRKKAVSFDFVYKFFETALL